MNTTTSSTNSSPNSRSISLAAGAVALIVIGVGVAAAIAMQDIPVTPGANLSVSPTTSAAMMTSSSYKAGTYQATGSYITPGGNEFVILNLVISDTGTVTESSVTASANNHDSARYQQLFTQNYKTFVNGKKIDQIHLNRVSGSSLTSGGFNSALEKIKDQAKI